MPALCTVFGFCSTFLGSSLLVGDAPSMDMLPG